MTKRQKIYLPFKRIFGIIGSLIGILFCVGLLWWWICLINLFITKGHIFFTHKRIGKDGKTFTLIKFRSMKIDADPNMTSECSDVDSQITLFGKFLRRTSLDETPQLINILKGDMSFIGPRPLIYAHEDIETVEERKANGSIQLRPGLSGYAQVHGRVNINPKNKGILDGYYFKHFSFWLDINLFIYTFLVVFRRKNVKKTRETS